MPYCDKKAVSFLLTTQCNLRCTYCYGARNTDKKVLDWRFAKRVLEDYVGAGKIKHIRFFADGEPTLEMELLKKIYEEAKRLQPNIQAEIQTNGVFSEETTKWLGENLDYVYVSIDLLPEAHDKYRVTAGGKPSSPVILKNLERFKEMRDKKAKIAVRATITKHNIEKQKEGIDFYHDKYGIEIFWVDPIFPPVSDVAEKTYEPIDMMQFAATFVDAHNYAWERGVFYESNLTTNFDGKTDKACRACLPVPHLTMDGYLSACEMATYGKDAGKMDAMIYARFDPEADKIIYDEEKLRILHSRVLPLKTSHQSSMLPDECHSCAAGEYCAGFCLGETLNENGSLFKIKTRVCKALKYIYGEIGHLYPDKFGPEGFPHKHP
jgi:radical SAM protein with 4Fe4S-binding SPASM domain